MCEIQKHLEKQKLEVVHRRMNSERKIEELRQAADSIRAAAWEMLDDFERLCVEHICSYICSVERKCTEMREKVGETEKAGIDWTNSQIGQLQRETSELRRRKDQLTQISLMQDPIQFLQSFHALADLPECTAAPESFNMLTQFVTAQKDQLKNMCNKEKNELFNVPEKNMLTNIPLQLKEVAVRPEFLANNTKVEVDPNTPTSPQHAQGE
ncbi:hypothetical protein LDENG_00205730 [Lucifuga dentata]|nr:hypothetical protein LDENG_00205730 [Lucifuga dentata]